MILALYVIALSFAWLLRETDYLRIRLPIGSNPLPEQELEHKTWDELKPHNITATSPNFLKMPGAYEPLCGREWLENTMHVIPVCKLEVNHLGVKHAMTIKDTSIINSVVSAMHARPTGGVKPIKLHKNKLGGYVSPLPAKS